MATGTSIVVSGYTDSSDFPTTPGAFQTSLRGAASPVVAKLDGTTGALIYSTFLGGSGSDFSRAIAVDSSGDAFVTGIAQSTDFPTLHPIQASLGGSGAGNLFVTELNPLGTGLVFSTFLGGSGQDFGNAISAATATSVFVAGTTNSPNFPTTPGAFQTTLGGSVGNAFMSKLSWNGSALSLGYPPFWAEVFTTQPTALQWIPLAMLT